jgi:hypothetical protein
MLVASSSHQETAMLRAPSRRRSRSPRRLLLEVLEARTVLSTITVTTLADDGTGSLRAAIAQANTAPDLDTIEFAPTVTGQITLLSALPDLTSNIIMTGPGASALDVTRSDATNTPEFRIFHVIEGANVAISGLTISNGMIGDRGCGVYNQGILTIASSVIRDNHGFAQGGGFYNSGVLTLVDSTIRDNSTTGSGGGVCNFAGTVTATNCTFTGNRSSGGGAVVNSGGMTTPDTPIITGIANLTNCVIRDNLAVAGGGIMNRGITVLTVVNSTILNNTSSGDSTSVYSGGGVCTSGEATFIGTTVGGNQAPNSDGGGFDILGGTTAIIDSTIRDNQSPYGAGIYMLAGKLSLTNSTVSGNSSPGNGAGLLVEVAASATVNDSTFAGNLAEQRGSGIFVFGTLGLQGTILDNARENIANLSPNITSLGHNLFSDTPAITLNPTDLVNTDPLLGPLADNGGPTQTMALLPGSPAIDAGTEIAGITTDQRGITRPQGSAPDIGAFESRGFSVALSAGNDQSAVVGSPFTSPLVVSVSSPYGEPVAGGVVNFSAPTNGPSADLNSGSVAIDGNGQASVNAVANGQIGSYNVATQSGGLIGPAFTLTNLAAPVVTTLERFGIHAQPTLIRVHFSRSMNAGRANNLGNYRLVTAGRDGKFGTKDDHAIRIRSARYDDVTHSVRLLPSKRLPLSRTYQLTINGTSPDGLTGTDGVFLGGAGRDRPGTNYVATFNRSALVVPTPIDRVHHARARRVHHKV